MFVILTAHADGTSQPAPPSYVNEVLVLGGVEISTDEGHYVDFDMTGAPYPLGGAAEAVVEDVTRLGGFGIAAHPDSPKPQLRWTDDRSPIDGIEWLNTDSEWRSESRGRLARAGIAYFLRPAAALASLFDRPVTLDRWDRLTATRLRQGFGRQAPQVVALAGADAHGGVKRVAEDPGRSLPGLAGIPSYEASFRAFTNRVVLERPLSGTRGGCPRIYAAIRKGVSSLRSMRWQRRRSSIFRLRPVSTGSVWVAHCLPIPMRRSSRALHCRRTPSWSCSTAAARSRARAARSGVS